MGEPCVQRASQSGKQPQEVGYFMTEVENQEDFSHYVGALNVKRAALDLEADAQRMISWSEKWPRMRSGCRGWKRTNIFLCYSILFDPQPHWVCSYSSQCLAALFIFFSRFSQK
jgi:hypothetical protein